MLQRTDPRPGSLLIDFREAATGASLAPRHAVAQSGVEAMTGALLESRPVLMRASHIDVIVPEEGGAP